SLQPSDATGYSVLETQPAGLLPGRNSVGSVNGLVNGQLASPLMDMITHVVLTNRGINYNFGELQPAGVAGFVYIDAKDNGINDSGESPIAGTTLTLSGTDDQGGQVSFTITTAADGSYGFQGLRPGNYLLMETQPAGFIPGRNTVGAINGTPDG